MLPDVAILRQIGDFESALAPKNYHKIHKIFGSFLAIFEGDQNLSWCLLNVNNSLFSGILGVLVQFFTNFRPF